MSKNKEPRLEGSGSKYKQGIKMVTGTNFKDINNVTDTKDALGKTLCNFAMGDGDSLCLGAGYIHHLPEKATQILLINAAKERHKDGLHNKLIQALETRNEELRAEIAQLKAQAKDIEDKFGGLDNMGKEAGLERKPNESDEQYKKRLKEDLQRRLENGTLDPNSDLAIWAQVMQGIDDREAELDVNNRALEKIAPSQQNYAEILGEVADLEERIAKGENEFEAPVLLEELKIAKAEMDVENEKLLTVVETLENSTADQVVHAWKSDNILIVNAAENDFESSINRSDEQLSISSQNMESESKLNFLDQFASP